jgi:hypothetical protein
VPIFTAEESSRLAEIVSMATPEYPKSKIGKLLIDLSWASSRLEGSTYTQLDTQSLIDYGRRNPDKPIEGKRVPKAALTAIVFFGCEAGRV